MATAIRTVAQTCIGVLLCGVMAVSWPRAAAVQQTPPPVAQAPVSAAQQAAEVSQAVSAARVFRDAGLYTEAANGMAAVLKKFPANSDAAHFQIDTLLLSDRFPDALTAYDRYLAARQRPDLPALGAVARADLKRSLRMKPDSITLVAIVLERLALDGDAGSRQSLKQLSDARRGATLSDLAPTISLARLKDAKAEAELGELLTRPASQDRAVAIEAIRDASATSRIPQVMALLSDSDLGVRSAAILALGALRAKEAVPQLQAAFQDDTGIIKLNAAIALKQLGQNSVDSFLADLLNSPVAEIRLMAATAFKNSTARGPAWDKAVRALMTGPNEVYGVQAAEMLACCDVAAAKSLLTSALASPNPLLRVEAAKVLESRKELADPAIARKIIGDAHERIRVYGDGMALALGRGGTRPSP